MLFYFFGLKGLFLFLGDSLSLEVSFDTFLLKLNDYYLGLSFDVELCLYF